METPGYLTWPLAVLGAIMLAYWWETTGLRFPHPRIYHFEQPLFILGVILFVVGIALFLRRSQEAM